MSRPVPIKPGPGQESVWDFPRPARFEPTSRHICIDFGGRRIVDTYRAIRAIETSHPPTYYIPPDDIAHGVLRATTRRSSCEWKGEAHYFDVVVGADRANEAAWAYPRPTANFAAIAGYVAFYARPMQACFVDDDRVVPQEGPFYGGWITSHVVGPFKGGPGTTGW